jgi:pullulanase
MLVFTMIISTFIGTIPIKAVDVLTTTVKIHYLRADGDYSKWNLWVWDAANNGQGARQQFIGKDEDGAFTAVTFTPATKKVGFIVRTDNWDKDTEDIIVDTSKGDMDVYVKAGDKQGNATNIQKPLEFNFDKVNLKVHYSRFDQNYTGWDLWMWPKDGDGAAYKFNEEDGYGKLANYTFHNMKGKSSVGVIVRQNEWNGAREAGGDRYINLAYADKNGTIDTYLIQDEPKLFYDINEVDKSRKVTSARMDSFHDISFQVNIPVANVEDVKLKNDDKIVEANVTLAKDKRSGKIKTVNTLDLNTKYTVAINEYKDCDVILGGNIYKSDDFVNKYHFSGELGALYSKEKTTFRVWSPVATKVSLKLYSEGVGSNLLKTIPMIKGDRGVWSVEEKGDLSGKFYTYEVTANGKTSETQDIYSKAVGINGDRSMVVDLSKTNPIGWENDKGPKVKNQTDAIVYEVHVRDISMDPNSGIKMKGKFSGFTEAGTKSKEGEATGIDHLKEMGVTHVQLTPVYDYASIDETKLSENKFNWGYDPKNYQVPEGSYSTDPYSGTLRIEEMKAMIKQLHDAGIGVIMDSVYNHTAEYENSSFNETVPEYYYRHNADGQVIGTSGCGNDTASEKSMYRKYMIDSVTYWAKEYHIDGFRFDLMGIHDLDTMNNIREELDKINPEILMYGEPWDLGYSEISQDQKVIKDNVNKLNPRIGAFSDDIRDGIKGHVFDNTTGGFVNYNGTWKRDVNGQQVPYTMGDLKELVKSGIVASTKHDGVDYSKITYSSGSWAKEPTQTVNYVSCHDNNTLWDRMTLTQPNATEADKIKMDKMANFLVLTSQGIAFLNSGEEMLRTKVNPNGKGFVENSYNSPDSVNQLEWTRKSTYKNVVNYYEGLIKLRKAHPAFRMATTAEIQKNLKFIDTNDSTIAYTISNNANGDNWSDIAVLVNAGKEDAEVTLPKSNWTVVANEEKAGTDAIDIISGNKIIIPAGASMVLADTESFNNSKLNDKENSNEANKDSSINENNNSLNDNKTNNKDSKDINNTDESANENNNDINDDKNTNRDNNTVINNDKATNETNIIKNNIEAIKEKINDSTIKKFVVDAKDNPIVLKSVFNELKGKNKEMTIVCGNVSWTFNGKDIKNDVTIDIDFSLKNVSIELKNKEIAKVKSVLGKEIAIAPFSFKYDGWLPGKAKVTIFIGADWSNKTVTVCRYFEENNTYEVVDEATANAQGYITIELNHCSDYFAIEKAVISNLPKTGSMIDGNVLIGVGILLLLAGGSFIVLSRKKRAAK